MITLHKNKDDAQGILSILAVVILHAQAKFLSEGKFQWCNHPQRIFNLDIKSQVRFQISGS